VIEQSQPALISHNDQRPGASKATISLAMDGNSLRLEISDNGKGFDANKSEALGVGITSIRERLRELEGSLEINPGSGSRIIAKVPRKPRAQVHCCCEFKVIQEPVFITPHLSCQSEITRVLGNISVFFGSAPALEKTYKRLGRLLRLLLKYPVARVFHDDNGYIFSNQFHLSPECFSQ